MNDPSSPPDEGPGGRVRQGAVLRRSARDRAAIRRRKLGLPSASLWILSVAFLYAMSGLFVCAVVRDEVQSTLADLAVRPDDAVVYVEIQGIETTVAEARAGLKVLELMTWLVNMGLVVILLALWWWSRRRPVPALTAALIFFLALTLVEFVLTDFDIGFWTMLTKVLCLAGLGVGLKTALDAAALDEPPSLADGAY